MTPHFEAFMWACNRNELPTAAADGTAFYLGSIGGGYRIVLWRKGRFRDVVDAPPL